MLARTETEADGGEDEDVTGGNAWKNCGNLCIMASGCSNAPRPLPFNESGVDHHLHRSRLPSLGVSSLDLNGLQTSCAAAPFYEMTKNTSKISFKPSEDDLAWLKEQCDSLGLEDPALIVGMLVRDARKKGLALSMVTAGASHQNSFEIRREPPFNLRQERHVAMPDQHTAAMNEPLPSDFDERELGAVEPLADEVSDALDNGLSAVDAMMAAAVAEQPADGRADQTVVSMPAASPTYRSRASRFRNGTAPHAFTRSGDPGSRTQLVSAGAMALADERDLSGQQRVVRQNMGHFFGRR